MHIFSIQKAVRFGWGTVRKNLGFFIALSLLVLGVSFLSGSLNSMQGAHTEASMSLSLISIILWVVNILLGIWVVKVGLDAVDATRLSFSNMIPAWEVVWKFVLTNIVASLILAVPAMLLVLLIAFYVMGALFGGGALFGMDALSTILVLALLIFLLLFILVYLSSRIMFSTYYVVDQRLGPIESVKASWWATRGIVWKLIGLMFILALINFAGILVFFVGILVTLPISIVATAYAYRALTDSHDFVPTPAGEGVEPVPTPEIGGE